jgi:hypothetical protein
MGEVIYTFKYKNLKFDELKLNAELKTPKGGLWRELERVTKLAVFLAKKQVGKKTGALAKSISSSHVPMRYGQKVSIFSNNKIAFIHHEGTKPHIIEGKRGGLLVFTNRTGGMVVTRTVHHPGTKPNPYLRNQEKLFKWKRGI